MPKAEGFGFRSRTITKERLFGLTNGEGNHGEDVKELYHYVDATPTHSYLAMTYRYPQRAYPYGELVESSVLDPFCRAHGVDNLYACDGSFFCSSGAVNPSPSWPTPYAWAITWPSA